MADLEEKLKEQLNLNNNQKRVIIFLIFNE